MYTCTLRWRTGLLSILCLYFALSSFGQTNWQLKSSVNGIQFYSAITNCNGSPAVILKFVNTTQNELKISWKEAFQVKGSAEKIEAFYGEKELTIAPGETAATGCAEVKNRKCVILPQEAIPTQKVTITDFEFREIKVSK